MTPCMKLTELYTILGQALVTCPKDPEVVLAFESDTLEGAFDLSRLESIKDIRVMDDWPLPGTSLIVPHETHDKLIVFFYGERDDALH